MNDREHAIRMDTSFGSEGVTLAAHLARPPGLARAPGLVLCHGFPSGADGAVTAAATYPEMADHLSKESGWVVLTFNFRGCGGSQGDFSIEAWLADLSAAVDHLESVGAASVWLAGSSLGGSLAVVHGARDPRVRGVATLAAPASLEEWAANPGRFLAYAREVGAVKTPGFPSDEVAWTREIASVDTIAAAAALAPRPLLVMHGDEDDVVSVEDARRIADADSTAELRTFHGAGHRLRHDPRVIATLVGWLARRLP